MRSKIFQDFRYACRNHMLLTTARVWLCKCASGHQCCRDNLMRIKVRQTYHDASDKFLWSSVTECVSNECLCFYRFYPEIIHLYFSPNIPEMTLVKESKTEEG